MSQNKGLTIAVMVLGVVAVAAVASSVTLWMARNNGAAPRQDAGSASKTIPAEKRNPTPSDVPVTVPPADNEKQTTGVFINEKEISQEQLDGLRQTYGAAPPKGKYWYDSRSGLYGYWGFESAGYIRPGHDFGSLSAQASNGNTGIFLNTRELNMTETQFFQKLFGAVYQGRYWLDGATGNIGVEGNTIPVANLVAAMQQAQRANQRSEYHWRDGSGAVIGSDGNCTFAVIPGAPVYSNPGC
jgi:hypothetical protein